MFSRGYIPADTLTACGLTVAMCDYADENSQAVMEELVRSYSDTYIDTNLREKIFVSCEAVKSSIPTLFDDPSLTNEHYAAACRTLTKAISKFKINGKKRGFFNGAIFKKETTPLEDPKAEVVKLLMIYHIHLQSGKIKP